MAKWDIRPDRKLARCETGSLSERISELEKMLEITERERVHHAKAWSDAQRHIIQLKAENARLRAASAFLRVIR
jgi:hypothetical protein